MTEKQVPTHSFELGTPSKGPVLPTAQSTPVVNHLTHASGNDDDNILDSSGSHSRISVSSNGEGGVLSISSPSVKIHLNTASYEQSGP